MTNRSRKLCESSGVSRRQALKIGARGIGLGLLGGVGPLPPLFGLTSEALAATPGKILVARCTEECSGLRQSGRAGRRPKQNVRNWCDRRVLRGTTFTKQRGRRAGGQH